MFAVTHAVAGFACSKLLNKNTKIFSAVGILAGIFPDFDLGWAVLKMNTLHPILEHRTITHSILLFPIWAFILSYLTAKILTYKQATAYSLKDFFPLFCLGILSHITLDMINSSGVAILAPFSFYKYTVPSFPFFTALTIELFLAGAITLFYLYQKINSATNKS